MRFHLLSITAVLSLLIALAAGCDSSGAADETQVTEETAADKPKNEKKNKKLAEKKDKPQKEPPSPLVTGREFFEETSGCIFRASDRKVACLHHALEMGFVTSTLTIYDIEEGNSDEQLVIYNGRSHDAEKQLAKAHNQKNIKQANAYLNKHGFKKVRPMDASNIEHTLDKERVTIKIKGEETQTAPLPAIDPEDQDCCDWEVENVTCFKDSNCITFLELACFYDPVNPKPGVDCSSEDYHPENLDPRAFVVSRKASK